MSGTGVGVVPNIVMCPVPALMVLLKCPVPVSISYQTYRSVRYRYGCRTEHNDAMPKLTNVSGTGIVAVPNISMCPVPVVPVVYTGRICTDHT